MSIFLGNTVDVPKTQFNLPHQFSIDNINEITGIVGDNNGSLYIWRTYVIEKTIVQQNSNKSNDTSLKNNSTSGTKITTNQINNDPLENSWDKLASTGTNSIFSATEAAPDNRLEGSSDA